MNLMKKENFKPLIVLSVICLIVALLLGALNMITDPEIKRHAEEKANESLLVVLPDGKNFEKIDITDAYPSEITRAYKADGGYVFEASVRGKEAMSVMCGVGSDGKIVKVEILSESETPGYKDKVFPLVTGDNGKYNGMSSQTLDAEIVSGATLSSTAIYNAVKASLNAYAIAAGGEQVGGDENLTPEKPAPIVSPKSDEELLALAKALVPNADSLEEVYLWSKPYNLVKLYNVGEQGYVAYLITLGYGGIVANEAFVHISTQGDIVAVNHVTCVVGHDIGLGDFAKDFEGKDYWNMDSVELISGATGTSGDLKSAIADATRVVVGRSLKSEEKLRELIDRYFYASCVEKMELSENAPDTLKALYREENGRGYIAYIVTIGSHSKAPESEVIVYFDNFGKIKDAEILVWTVGHDTEPGDFADRLKGLTESELDGVELVSGSTGTSGNILQAVKDALPFVPVHFPIYRVIGIAAVAVALVASVTAAIIVKKRRSLK